MIPYGDRPFPPPLIPTPIKKISDNAPRAPITIAPSITPPPNAPPPPSPYPGIPMPTLALPLKRLIN